MQAHFQNKRKGNFFPANSPERKQHDSLFLTHKRRVHTVVDEANVIEMATSWKLFDNKALREISISRKERQSRALTTRYRMNLIKMI
jgi:hypothetical protein